MNGSDDLMFEYLLQMGAMRPEQEELMRRQAQVEALRKSSMTPMEGQMIGKHYIAPSLMGAIGKIGEAYFANKSQQGVDASMKDMNTRQRQMLEELRKRRSMNSTVPTTVPPVPVPGMINADSTVEPF